MIDTSSCVTRHFPFNYACRLLFHNYDVCPGWSIKSGLIDQRNNQKIDLKRKISLHSRWMLLDRCRSSIFEVFSCDSSFSSSIKAPLLYYFQYRTSIICNVSLYLSQQQIHCFFLRFSYFHSFSSINHQNTVLNIQNHSF